MMDLYSGVVVERELEKYQTWTLSHCTATSKHSKPPSLDDRIIQSYPLHYDFYIKNDEIYDFWHCRLKSRSYRIFGM